MKMLKTIFLALALCALPLHAETLPPGAVQIRDAAGNKVTTTNEGSGVISVNAHITNPGGASTVTANQGTAGGTPWPVTVSNFPGSQPISGSVSVSNFPGTQAVTGTFFQATQPVSGSLGRTWSLLNTTDSVNVGNFPATQPVSIASPVAVTGTFFQATQPVSGSLGRSWSLLNTTDSVNVGNFPATQAVTGTFFQATQPVSIAAPVAVTGTFFQATQPVSGTVTANAGTNLNTSALALESGHLASIDTKLTSPLTANSTLQAGSAVVGKVGIDQTTPGTTNGVVVNSSALPTGAATAAGLTTINTTLGTPMQQTGGSLSVTSSALPTGAATSANQATANTSLATIVTNTTGIATAANQVTSNTNTGTTASNTTSILANQTNGTQKTQVTAIPADVSPATQPITTQDLASTTTPSADGQNLITGTPTAGSAASFAIASASTVQVLVTGTWTGTLVSEISMDGGVTWITRGLKHSSYVGTSFTQNVQGDANASGMTNYRMRATGAMTGTATVKITASVNPASVVVSNAATLRDATTQSITNTIKAASTAAVATDTALVVSVSPNNTPVLPSGASTAANQATANSTLSTLALQSGSNTTLNHTGSGTISSISDTVAATTNGASTCTFITSGTFSAVLIFVGVTNGVTTSTASIPFSPAGAALSVFVSANTTVVVPVGGFGQMVAKAFSFTSGTANINWECGSGSGAAGYTGIATATLASSATIGSVSLGNSTGKVNKSITGNLTSTATTANQTVVTYTVTAGKTFYLEEFDCGAVLNSAAATQTVYGTCQLSINGSIVWQQYYKGPGSGSFLPVISYSEPIPVTAGQVITLQATPSAITSFFWYGNIGGYEK